MKTQTPCPTQVDIDLPKGRITVSGTAVAVILIVALLGMAYVSVRAIELGQHAVDQSKPESVSGP